VVVRPPFIINEPYRKSIRLLAAGQEIIPSEVHYKALLEQLAGIAPSTQKPSRVVRERLLDGLVSIMHETLLFMNYPSRPVYYNKIEKLVTSRLYKLMQFHPEGFLFKLSSEPQLISMEELAALGKHPAAAGNAGSAIVSDFISETAQNFWSQKRIAPALELFRTCTSLHPRNIECGFFTGLILKQQGDYAESEKHFYQTLKLLDEKSMTGPTETIDMFMYERIYTELGMLDEAEKYRRLSQPGMPANHRSACGAPALTSRPRRKRAASQLFAFIIISAILNLDAAFSECGTFAGMIIASPLPTRFRSPPTNISASPSST